jgi:hypothetical protein
VNSLETREFGCCIEARRRHESLYRQELSFKAPRNRPATTVGDNIMMALNENQASGQVA